MPRLVTGVFYDRGDAQRAMEALTASGIPADCIYLEEEVPSSEEVGWKGGEVRRCETERRFAGLQSGMIIGLIVGAMGGMVVGFLGDSFKWMVLSAGMSASAFDRALAEPAITTLVGAIAGLAVGAIIGWLVDYTLTRLGAGPALPSQEALVSVRTDESMLNQVYDTMFQQRARHMHVSQAAPI